MHALAKKDITFHLEGQSCVWQLEWESIQPHGRGSENFFLIVTPPSALAQPEQTLCGWSAAAEMGHLLRQKDVSVEYPQHRYLILECSECIQHVAWKFISSPFGSCSPSLPKRVGISGGEAQELCSHFFRGITTSPPQASLNQRTPDHTCQWTVGTVRNYKHAHSSQDCHVCCRFLSCVFLIVKFSVHLPP